MKTSLLLLCFTVVASSSFAQTAPKPAAAPPPAAQAAPPVAPFPAGAKIAFVNVQYIAANSAEGKVANNKVSALVQKKQAEIAASQKNPADAQRIQQQAQTDVQKLQNDLQTEFQKKLMPVLQQMAQEKHLSLLMSAQDAGLIWAEPGLDLTAEAIKRLDASTSKTPAK